MDTVKKTTKNIAKSNRVIANKFNIDDEDFYKNKKESTILRDIAKTNNYIAGRLSSVNEPNGLVELDENGMINSDQLPSYVDDAVEGYYYNGAFYSDSSHQYEIVPESGKIYVDTTDPSSSKSYRWTGSTYILIGCSSFNDLEPEATFNLIYNAFTDTYTVTCNKRASDLSNSPLIEISMLGDTYKEVAFKSVSTVTAYFNIGTKIMTFAFTDNGYSWSVVYKESTVAVTGSYNDLTDKPTIPDAQVQSDWNQSDNTQLDYIKNKPDLPTNTSFDDIFYINILSDNSIITIQNSRNDDVTLMYSLDKTTWTTITIISNTSNQYLFNKCKVYFKSDLGYLGINDGTTTKYVSFSVDKDFEIGGKLVYLISSNGIEPTTIPSKCFLSTFSSSHLISAKNLILLSVAPALCYYTTFQSTSLVETPNLIAEYPESGAYYGMFAHTVNTLRRVISSAKIWTSQDMYIGNSWYNGGEFINLGMAPSVIRTRAGAPTDWTIKTPAFINDFKNIPTPTQSDSGKLLSVDANGDYELITIVNSENIAY